MTEDQQDPIGVGQLIRFFRWLKGWSQAKLARRTGLHKSQISLYESETETPRPATFRRIATETGVPLRLVEFIRWNLRLIRKALATEQAVPLPPGDQVGLQEATRAAVWSAVARAMSLARVELALLRNTAPSGRLHAPTGQDVARADSLLERLRRYPEARQRLLVEGARAYRDWLLAHRACLASKRAAADDPGEALKLAELALYVARHVDGTDAWRSRLQGLCTGFIVNAQRVGNDFPAAEATFARAWRLWRNGEDEAGLLSEAHLLDLEASLRGDQRLFPQALKLHEDAKRLARPEEVGSILLNKACTLQEKGDHEEALRTLDEAAQAIDGECQPRLRCVLRFNQAANLLRLGRAQEAVPIIAEVRELAERLRNDHDLVRTLWLEGNLDAGLGRRDEALAKLEQVRSDFEHRRLPFDYALASLDVALLYREDGSFAEIQALAGEILKIFEALEVHREAVAAVLLFREAAENQAVSAELVRRIQDYLARAQKNPRLRFEA